MTDELDPLIGRVLSQAYEVTRLIAQGGMGRVYAARHTRLPDRHYAVKVVRTELAQDEVVLARFRREVQAVATIQHAHVMAIHDVDQLEDGRPFFVAELLEGIDLWQVLSTRGRMPVALAVDIVSQICLGLQAAHARGVIHRDIKPENIFLSGDLDEPTVKIVDFGISQSINKNERALTRTGLIIGTPGYMAPEQIEARDVDQRTDLYATGALLYRMLTGAEPFNEVDPAATLFAVLGREPVPPRELDPSIPVELEAIIQKAMAKRPENRYRAMAELRGELAPFVAQARTQHELDAPTRVLSPVVEHSLHRARPRLFGLVTLLSSGLALGLIWAIESTFRFLSATSASVTASEAALITVAVCSALGYPLWIVWRRLAREVWPNSARVLQIVGELQWPTMAALACYAGLDLAIGVYEGLVVRASAGLAWPVWTLLKLGTCVSAAAWTHARARSSPPERGRVPAFLPSMAAAALLATVVVVAGSTRSQENSAAAGVAAQAGLASDTLPIAAVEQSPPDPVEPPQDVVVGSDPPPVANTPAVQPPPPPPVEVEQPDPSRELNQARVAGATALIALARRYPQDPAVLRSLTLAHAERPEQFEAFAAALARLVAVDPGARNDRAFITVLVDATQVASPRGHSERAVEILAHEMGSAGVDALFTVDTRRASLRRRIDAALADPATLAGATPALRIAHALRNAEGCNAATRLLDAAARDGDQRAIDLLEPLTVGRRRGCGFLGMKRCRARCAREADAIHATIATISDRINARPGDGVPGPR